MKRRFWTAQDDSILREFYPHEATWKTARRVRRPVHSVYAHANNLGLHKTAEYLASEDACRLRRGDQVGKAYRFPKGHQPANKGLRRPGWAPGRMAQTQFKKGESTNKMPLGSERLIDGYLYVKVAEVPNVAYMVNWKPVHILAWERANGRALPDGHCLFFRDGNRLNCEVSNLELLTRADNMKRNSVHQFPKDLVRAIQARGVLNRRINSMEKAHGQQHA